MFFPDRIKSIKTTDRVLEIGPGGNPHPRSDVFLEKNFENEEIAFIQRGFERSKEVDKQTVYYEGGKFSFKDNEFDYIIFSHVMEHKDVEPYDTVGGVPAKRICNRKVLGEK